MGDGRTAERVGNGNEVIEASTGKRGVSEAFEVLTTLLKRFNFKVWRRKLVRDINGVEHVIDLLAEGELIPGIRLRLAFITHPGRIGVNDIEWYAAKKALLPSIDKFVVIAAKGVDVEALELGSKLGIGIIRYPEFERVAPLLVGPANRYFSKVFIKPKARCEDVVAKSLKFEKPGIFSKRRCRLDGFTLAFIPLIRVDARFTVEELEGSSVLIEEASLVFDGVRGYCVVRKGDSIGIDEAMGSFTELPERAIEALSIVSRRVAVPLGELSAEMNIDMRILKNVIDMLASRGLIDVYGDLVEMKYSSLKMFADPLKATGSEEVLSVKERVPSSISRNASVVLPRVPVLKLIRVAGAMNGEVRDVKVIYYPAYIVLCIENNHTEKVIAIDGLTGEVNEDLAKIIDNYEVIKTVLTKLRPVAIEQCKELSLSST
ncbi:MAG: hypothetical protein DRO09_01645 [Thermoprotei archaeon]|nr:MAG: hypothetical protein DRO09_01645 [Thermoprotei archaeon]